tara:strand:+ start:128 stop:421 length:294 start_codon:yes stop_codon:yes gene_type:complete
MELYNNETDHTSSKSQVYLEGNKMYQQIDEYRDIANQNQLSAIVENLTLDKGFLIEQQKNKTFRLVNPTDPETSYWIFVDELGISKRTIRFIGEVEL